MKNLTKENEITSLDLLKEINLFREQEYYYKIENNLSLNKVEERNGKYTELRHDTLLNIIRDEFEEEISSQNILEATYLHPQNKQKYIMFILTLEQAKQVLMRESKYVRKGVIAYINSLEKKVETLVNTINKKDLLKLNIINANTEMDRMVALNQYQIEYVQPLEIKAEYTDKVLSSEGTLTVKEIAQDFGKTANWLNKILNTLGIQYKQGSKWHLYAKYKDLGLVKEITVYDEENDRNFTRMKWTQKGREFIHNLLKENEIIR